MIAPEMIAQAFANTFNPMCLFLIWFGTIIGIIFGSIPGLSATMAVVLFLPLTFGMEATQGLALSGRDEAGDRDVAMPRLFDDFVDGGLMLLDALLEREAHMEEEGRGEEGGIADGGPAALRVEEVVAQPG